MVKIIAWVAFVGSAVCLTVWGILLIEIARSVLAWRRA